MMARAIFIATDVTMPRQIRYASATPLLAIRATNLPMLRHDVLIISHTISACRNLLPALRTPG